MSHDRLPRRLAALFIAAAALITAAVPALAAGAGDFGDVSGSAWYYSAVDFVSRKGLFQGTSSGVFSPNGTMTRAMFITVLGRYAGVNAATWCAGSVSGDGVNMRSGPGTDHPVVTTLNSGAALTIQNRSGDWYQVSAGSASGYIRSDYVAPRYHTFSDVSFSSYYAGYATWAYEKGIIQGDGSSSIFSPNKNITREQACAILYRFASVMGASIASSGSAATFTDDSDISSWSKDSVYALSRAGIVKGRDTGAFDPAGNASRAEAAAIIQRFDTSVGGFKAPAGQQGVGGEEAPAPTAGPEEPPASQEPELVGLLANAAVVDHLSQGDRGCCLATSFSMAANLILGRNEYGAFDWTASDTNDSLSFGGGTSFQGSDGYTYKPSTGGGSEADLRAAIDSALGSGCPIIISVRNASTALTHYVLAFGWTDSAHSDYLIADPSGGGTSLLESGMPMAEKNYELGNKDGTFTYIVFSRS